MQAGKTGDPLASTRLTLQPSKTGAKTRYKRTGKPTKPEKALVAAFIADQPMAVTEALVAPLSKVLRRSKDQTKQIIEDAKEALIDNTKRYVNIHMEATEAALVEGSPKALDVATKAAQWALENIGEGGTKVVEAAPKGDSGTRVMIGIKVGGGNAV